MSRFITALRWDVVLQARNGFYWATAFLIVLVGGLLLALPETARADRALWVPAVLAVNLQITTFFFVAGLLLLERDEGTITALAVSPLSPGAYLASRIVTLVVLAAVETFAVVWIAFGSSGAWPLIIMGTLALGAIYTGFGAAVGARYASLNAFLLPGSAGVTLLLLPLIPHFGLAPRAPFLVHPIEPPLALLRAAYGPADSGDIVFGLAGSAVWVTAAFVWGRNRVRRLMRATGAHGAKASHHASPARDGGTASSHPAPRARAQPLLALLESDARLLVRDPLLAWVILLPIGLALVLRVLIPPAEAALLRAGFDLMPYHPLIMGGYLMTAPGIVGMVIGFLLLDERDARTLAALRVTPLSMRRYLAFRVAVPLVVGSAATLVGYPLTGIAALSLQTLLPLAVIAGFSAPLLALVLATAAPNKVAGFAVTKVANGINLLPIAAFFLPLPLQWAAGVLPPYWPMRALWSATAGEPYAGYLLVGGVVNVLALTLAMALFERRLLQRG
jgi:hypothetical protein